MQARRTIHAQVNVIQRTQFKLDCVCLQLVPPPVEASRGFDGKSIDGLRTVDKINRFVYCKLYTYADESACLYCG